MTEGYEKVNFKVLTEKGYRDLPDGKREYNLRATLVQVGVLEAPKLIEPIIFEIIRFPFSLTEEEFEKAMNFHAEFITKVMELAGEDFYV